MSIKLAVTKNETLYYPDIANNLDLPEKDRFCFVLQRKSFILHSEEWAIQDKKGNKSIDQKKYIEAHVKEILNPPILDDNGKEIPFCIDHFFDGKYRELFPLFDELFLKIGEVDKIEVKK